MNKEYNSLGERELEFVDRATKAVLAEAEVSGITLTPDGDTQIQNAIASIINPELELNVAHKLVLLSFRLRTYQTHPLSLSVRDLHKHGYLRKVAEHTSHDRAILSLTPKGVQALRDIEASFEARSSEEADIIRMTYNREILEYYRVNLSDSNTTLQGLVSRGIFNKVPGDGYRF